MIRSLYLIAVLFPLLALTQPQQQLHEGWQFRKAGSTLWYPAVVPGTVHEDLLRNRLIEDPFYGSNEQKVQWVEQETWEYRLVFKLHTDLRQQELELVFEGLDTDADVFLNDQKVLSASNMFIGYTLPLHNVNKADSNTLLIRFHPSAKKAARAKAEQATAYPDNERVFVRKAQYQFGWDWGPRLVTCGIWKAVSIQPHKTVVPEKSKTWNVELVRERDSIGESFYFKKDGQPVFIHGANWIPADNFIPRAVRTDKYLTLLTAAKEAGLNMLRVWGGGIYEDERFYSLCDSLGIMVWQDFMFAGALYPADSASLQSIAAEVRYQVNRLRKHPCIVLWCGNNEIEEAWFNWGWQQQLQYSAADSLRLWNDYRFIFHDLIPGILKELDPSRPYWPSSPSLGWGRDSAYRKGDVHYWGVWWGKEPVEKYREKVGRFNSEYGMQGMPSLKTIGQFSSQTDWDTTGVVMRNHQKHPFGYENIQRYIINRFRKPKDFANLVYVSQLMQADAIKIAVDAHRMNAPVTMGTLFWQWNDCWPAVSWSAIDYYGRKKALFFEVKRSFAEEIVLASFTGKKLHIRPVISAQRKPGITIESCSISGGEKILLKRYVAGHNVSDSFNIEPAVIKNRLIVVSMSDSGRVISRQILFKGAPKDLPLRKPVFSISVTNHYIEISSDVFAYGVFLDLPDGIEPSDNYFHLLPGEKKRVAYKAVKPLKNIGSQLKIHSLRDSY
jgi:beta-mannosidase